MGEAINMIMTEDQAITGMFSLQQKWRNNTKTSVSSTTMSAFVHHKSSTTKGGTDSY